MYVYGFTGDKTIEIKFGGIWDTKRKRWLVSDEMKEQVLEYISLVSQSDDEQLPRHQRSPTKRRKRTHRSESFDSSNSETEQSLTEVGTLRK
jgi:hypothetical protein